MRRRVAHDAPVKTGGGRSCRGWSKVADYAHRAALRADSLASNPPSQLGMSAACPVRGCRTIPGHRSRPAAQQLADHDQLAVAKLDHVAVLDRTIIGR